MVTRTTTFPALINVCEQIKKRILLFNMRRDFLIATNAPYGNDLGTDNSTDAGYSVPDLLRRLISRVFAPELDIFSRFKLQRDQ